MTHTFSIARARSELGYSPKPHTTAEVVPVMLRQGMHASRLPNPWVVPLQALAGFVLWAGVAWFVYNKTLLAPYEEEPDRPVMMMMPPR